MRVQPTPARSARMERRTNLIPQSAAACGAAITVVGRCSHERRLGGALGRLGSAQPENPACRQAGGSARRQNCRFSVPSPPSQQHAFVGPVGSPRLTTSTADSLEILPTDHRRSGHALPLDKKRAFVFPVPQHGFGWDFQSACARTLRWVATTFRAIGYTARTFGDSSVWRTCLVSARAAGRNP